MSREFNFKFGGTVAFAENTRDFRKLVPNLERLRSYLNVHIYIDDCIDFEALISLMKQHNRVLHLAAFLMEYFGKRTTSFTFALRNRQTRQKRYSFEIL